MGVDFFSELEMSKFLNDLDVVVLTIPLAKFEDVVYHLPAEMFQGKLLVDMSPLNTHPKEVMLRAFENYANVDLLCSHLILGPAYAAGDTNDDDSANSLPSVWDGRPMVYEKVRVSDIGRCEKYLRIFEDAQCQLVEMSAEQHDASVADAEFVTHLAGRLLYDKDMLPPTPVVSKEFAALLDIANMASADSFDRFLSLFKLNSNAQLYMKRIRENMATLEQKLTAKEAYLEASTERQIRDRQSLISETKLLLQELVRNGGV